MQCTNRKQHTEFYQKTLEKAVALKKKSLTTATLENNARFTNMDPKHYLPFQPLHLSHDTISCADSQGSPSS